MKLKTVILGQTVCFIRLVEPVGGIYLPDFDKAIRERYKFVTVPKSIGEFDRNKGIKYEHGLYKKGNESIVINKLLIYNNGLIVEVPAYAEDSDLILDDMVAWAISDLGYSQDAASPVSKGYMSQIEVEMQNPFPSIKSKPSSAASTFLSKKLSSYGIETKPFEEIALTLHVDTLNVKIPIPSLFKLERREGFGFESNVFYSVAPLKTKDHLSLLQEIESNL